MKAIREASYTSSGASRAAAAYIISRHVQNESDARAPRYSVRPRMTRWKACECALTIPGSIARPLSRTMRVWRERSRAEMS